MDVHAALDAGCDADDLFGLVDDLGRYPDWIDLVHRAERVEADPPTWHIELRARVGPLARSKRLRMVRTEHSPADRVVVFERHEADGRRHSPWVLRATVGEGAGHSALNMHLHYGGGLWTGGVLERVLAEQITNGRERLVALVRQTH